MFYNQETGQLICEWNRNDILSVRDNLTKEQVDEIMFDLADNFDANNGINWEVIQMQIDQTIGDN